MLDIPGPRVTFLALEICYMTASEQPSWAWRARGRRARQRARGTGKYINFLTLQNKPPLKYSEYLVQNLIRLNLERGGEVKILNLAAQAHFFINLLLGGIEPVSRHPSD